MKLKTNKYLFLLLIVLLAGCNTTKDLEEMYEDETKAEQETNGATSEEELEQLNEEEMKEYLVSEEMKVVDVEQTVLWLERPVYIPEEKSEPSLERGNTTGLDAVMDSQKKAVVKPEQYKLGTFFYQYNENLVYEVYAQPYHLTDIVLEKGEIVTATPLLSEDESVWELTAGVAKDQYTGEDIQHLFIKPAYTGLDSTLVIITDRRVYHFRIKSYKDTHMAMVKFTYPSTRNQWATKSGTVNQVVNDYVHITNPELLSFDYKMKYSMWKKPEFLPQRVYDDGSYTYIQVDEIVLQKKLPVIFNEKNEIVNYSVKNNVFVIPRLINKVTLRLGKEKVTITKKKTSKKEAEEIEKAAEIE